MNIAVIGVGGVGGYFGGKLTQLFDDPDLKIFFVPGTGIWKRSRRTACSWIHGGLR